MSAQSSTSTSPRTGAGGPALAERARERGRRDRWRRGPVLVAGAVLLLLAVAPVGPLPYAYLPLIAGLTLLVAAAASGRRSPFWAAGLVVASWGLGTVLLTEAGGDPAWTAALPLLLLGAGTLAVAALGARGWTVDTAAVGRAVLFIGAGQLLRVTTEDRVTALFAALLAGWGLWEMTSPLAARSAERAAAQQEDARG